MELKIDLHIHSERSPDGCMTLAEIAARARAAGLDGAAVCDHDRTLEEVPEFPDFLLIPGVEVSTEYGHLLGLFVREPIGTRRFAEAVERIHSQGGLAVLAHPFEHSRDAGRIAPGDRADLVLLLLWERLDYLRHGRPGPFFQGVADCFRAKEALSCREDPAPMRRYLRNNLLRR